MDNREGKSPDERNVDVTFVDYGENALIKLSDTRKLKQDFLHLPFQAVECGLDGIFPPARHHNSDTFWSTAACELITDLAKVRRVHNGNCLLMVSSSVDCSFLESTFLFCPTVETVEPNR